MIAGSVYARRKSRIDHSRKTLSIDLHGRLAGILSLATKAKKPLGESIFPVEPIKLVAGARNHLYRTTLRRRYHVSRSGRA